MLGAVGIHPGARALALPGIRIEVPKTHVYIAMFDFPDSDVWMENRDVLGRHKRKAQQPLRHHEHGVPEFI